MHSDPLKIPLSSSTWNASVCGAWDLLLPQKNSQMNSDLLKIPLSSSSWNASVCGAWELFLPQKNFQMNSQMNPQMNSQRAAPVYSCLAYTLSHPESLLHQI